MIPYPGLATLTPADVLNLGSVVGELWGRMNDPRFWDEVDFDDQDQRQSIFVNDSDLAFSLHLDAKRGVFVVTLYFASNPDPSEGKIVDIMDFDVSIYSLPDRCRTALSQRFSEDILSDRCPVCGNDLDCGDPGKMLCSVCLNIYSIENKTTISSLVVHLEETQGKQVRSMLF